MNLESLGSSFFLIGISEIGDKTQFLAISLASRYQRPGPILAAVVCVAVVSHALASVIGVEFAQLVSTRILSACLAMIFVGCGVWSLMPEEVGASTPKSKYNLFFYSAALLFVAEMGDKTQIATLALAAKFHDALGVAVGGTLGFSLVCGLSVIIGHRLSNIVSTQWIKKASAAAFFAFAAYSLYQVF